MVAAVVVHYLGSLRGLKRPGDFLWPLRFLQPRRWLLQLCPLRSILISRLIRLSSNLVQIPGSSLRLHCKKYLFCSAVFNDVVERGLKPGIRRIVLELLGELVDFPELLGFA